jgi:cell division protein FtsA
MAKKHEEKIIVGLDIGTSKVMAVVGNIDNDGELEIIGIGQHISRGLRKGVVADIDSTVHSIQCAVEEAELTADCQINSVFAGIAGSHIRSMNSHGVVAIRDREVGHDDVERVIEAARAQSIPDDQRVLHILPQDFIIDGQEGVREPIAMSGVRLEAKVHIVTAALSAAQNIDKCVRRCGLAVDDLILEQLASSYAVLDDDEKDLGVCLVDIGGGTTDIAIFTEGAIRHTAVLPVAGDQVTNDIAVALRTPTQAAEELKKKFGYALVGMAPEGESIDAPSVGDRAPRKLALSSLVDVVEPRIEELFLLVQAELRRSGYAELLGAGIVLTGGSSKMEGMEELGEEVFQLPVRLGTPQYAGPLSEVVRNPICSTGMGLLIFGHQHRSESAGPKKRPVWPENQLQRLNTWFRHHFTEE